MSDNRCNKKKVVGIFRGPGLPLQPINVADFRKQCVAAHNMYRELHCCPPVTMCLEMNELAMQWATNLARKKNMESRHFDNYGENLYMADFIDVPGDLPVKRWYEEIENYQFATSKFTPCVAHFTQVIWKNTREIGIGVARHGSTTYVVVNYFPPGNIEGQFAKMVPRKVL